MSYGHVFISQPSGAPPSSFPANTAGSGSLASEQSEDSPLSGSISNYRTQTGTADHTRDCGAVVFKHGAPEFGHAYQSDFCFAPVLPVSQLFRSSNLHHSPEFPASPHSSRSAHLHS